MFKARMIYYAAFDSVQKDEDGCPLAPPHWFELAKEHWTQVYRSTGTPCSCWMCQGEKYNRLAYKQETRRVVNEAMHEVQ